MKNRLIFAVFVNEKLRHILGKFSMLINQLYPIGIWGVNKKLTRSPDRKDELQAICFLSWPRYIRRGDKIQIVQCFVYDFVIKLYSVRFQKIIVECSFLVQTSTVKHDITCDNKKLLRQNHTQDFQCNINVILTNFNGVMLVQTLIKDFEWSNHI